MSISEEYGAFNDWSTLSSYVRFTKESLHQRLDGCITISADDVLKYFPIFCLVNRL